MFPHPRLAFSLRVHTLPSCCSSSLHYDCFMRVYRAARFRTGAPPYSSSLLLPGGCSVCVCVHVPFFLRTGAYANKRARSWLACASDLTPSKQSNQHTSTPRPTESTKAPNQANKANTGRHPLLWYLVACPGFCLQAKHP